MIGANESNNVARLDYLYLNLVGQTVHIHTVDGAICEGLFVSRTDADVEPEEAGVFISYPRFLSSKLHGALEASELSDETRLFHYEDIMMMEAKSMKLRTETPGSGHVYAYRGDHDLKTLDWAAEGADELLDAGSHVTGQWDQFKANEKFGVRTSYSEDLYTTKLDESKLSKEQIAYAERTAKEIESSGTRNLQHRLERADVANEFVDEGALFSDVTRDARVTKRSAQALRKEAAASNANQNASPNASPTAPNAPASASRGSAASTRPPAPPQPAEEPPQQQPPQQQVAPPPPPVEAATPPAPASSNKANKGQAAVPPPAPAIAAYSPNPSATPFVPPLKSFLANVAALVSSNANCYMCPTDWPGDIDFYDRDVSHYSRPQQQQSPQGMHHKYNPQGMNQPPQGRGPMNHHQQHPMMAPQAVYNNSPGPMGGHMGNPHAPPPPQHLGYGDNGSNNGMVPPPPPQQQQQPPPPPPQPPQPPMQGPSSSSRMGPQRTSKTSQPQQPVHTATQSLPPPPQQQQPQPPPPPQQPVSAIDSSSPPPDRAASGAKKLRRGGMVSAARQDAGDNAPSGKKGGK